MKRLAILALAGLTLAACSDPKAAMKALDDAGFTDITVGGYAAWSCGKDDSYATKFTATNPRGKRVSGAVCSGWTKGSTIRFD